MGIRVVPSVQTVESAEALLRNVLGRREDFSREEFQKTPFRLGKALVELLDGYDQDPVEVLGTTFPADGYDQIVCVRQLPFVSLCAHHVLAFQGHVSVAYLPGRRIIGLSKIPRLVRVLSRRLQVQERLTKQIADALMKAIKPRAVAVVAEGVHSCMAIRGIESQGKMVTSVMLGQFRSQPAARAEVLSMLRGFSQGAGT